MTNKFMQAIVITFVLYVLMLMSTRNAASTPASLGNQPKVIAQLVQQKLEQWLD